MNIIEGVEQVEEAKKINYTRSFYKEAGGQWPSLSLGKLRHYPEV
jgi:hypothetical protein